MTATAWLLAFALALAVVLVLAVLTAHVRRQARASATRRAAAMDRLATTLDRVASELALGQERARPLRTEFTAVSEPIADPATGLPARAALVDELTRRVGSARSEGGRLGVALVAVETRGPALEQALADVARAVHAVAPDAEAFRAGERSLALVLPGAGRADAIAAVARLEATLGGTPQLTTRATELAPDEDAAVLLSRILSPPD